MNEETTNIMSLNSISSEEREIHLITTKREKVYDNFNISRKHLGNINFTYADGEKNFFGVIRSNNKNFYWVSPESKGYIHGEILNINTIEVCYTEAYRGAAVGCSILKRVKE